MGCVLGIAIPTFVIGVFAILIWRVVRSGLQKKKRNKELMRYAADDLNGRVEGSCEGRRFSLEFAIVQCSADPSADARSLVPRMQRLETVIRMPGVDVKCRALVGKPFFRGAIHDPLRGAESVDTGDPGFHQTFQVLASSEEGCEWLDADVRSTLLRLDARELRIDQGELSLNLDRMIVSPKRFDLAVGLMAKVASQVGAR